MSKRFATRLLPALLASLTLAACGQRGPLMLPNAATPAAESAEPESESGDEERDENERRR